MTITASAMATYTLPAFEKTSCANGPPFASFATTTHTRGACTFVQLGLSGSRDAPGRADCPQNEYDDKK